MRRITQRGSWFAFGALLASTCGSADAQPCARYKTAQYEDREVAAHVATLAPVLAIARDERAPAVARVRAIARSIPDVLAFGARLDICTRAPAAASQAVRDSLRYQLDESSQVATDLADRCLELVRRYHLGGPEAAQCMRLPRSETTRLAAGELVAPLLPRAWAEGDLDGSPSAYARVVRDARPRDRAARRALAAVQIATTDFPGARTTLGSLPAEYDTDLLRAIATFGVAGRFGRDTADALGTLDRLAREAPTRLPAHRAYAIAAETAGGWSQPELHRALDHARAWVCLLDPERSPDEADRATRAMAGFVHRLSSFPGEPMNVFAYYGDGPPPPLPLPLERLGPEAQQRFGGMNMRVSATCADVLAHESR